MNGQAGKGDKPRPVDKNKYDKNWERIFGKKMKLTNYCPNCKQIVIVDRHKICRICHHLTKDEQ